MRVLQINTICKSGSTGKIVYDIHTSLLKDGHESAICYGRGPVIDEPNIYKFGSELGFRVHVLITRVFGITGMASNWSTNKLFKYIKEFRPDVVHLHNIHGYYVNTYRLLNYLKKNNIKTVITLHDDWLFTGNCGYAYECEKWKNGCGGCKATSEYPKSILLDFTKLQHRLKRRCFEGFNNLTIVSPSQWLANRAKESFMKDKNIQVIHNGIDTENIFYPRKFEDLKIKHGLKDEKIVLAVTPNFSDERKGGKYVLELAKKLEKEDVKIIIVGVNNKVEGISNKVIIIPRTEDQEELAQYYSMADVFVLTSKFETFSMVCAESVACGTSIIGFESGAPDEIFKEPYGKFISFGDVDKLKDEVLKKLSHNNKFDSEDIQYNRLRYSKNMMFSAYMEVYIKNKEIYNDPR